MLELQDTAAGRDREVGKGRKAKEEKIKDRILCITKSHVSAWWRKRL